MPAFRFKKPQEYPNEETGGGGTAVAEAQPVTVTPERAALEELQREDETLATLEQQFFQLQDAVSATVNAVNGQRQFLSQAETPAVLLQLTDEQLREHESRLRSLIRAQGQAEADLAAFTAQHGDIRAARQRLQPRIRTAENAVLRAEHLTAYFVVIAELEPVLNP